MLETVIELFQQAHRRNWIIARDGNASVRWRHHDYFYVTPSGLRKQTLKPNQFIKYSLTGHGPLYDADNSNLVPSGELPLHLRLQQNIDTETRAVLHVHTTYIVAAMYAGIRLKDLANQFPELGRYTKVGKNIPEVEPTSEQLAEAVCPELIDSSGRIINNIVGIDRHGVVSIDTDPWLAFEHVERLEHICKIVLAGGKQK